MRTAKVSPLAELRATTCKAETGSPFKAAAMSLWRTFMFPTDTASSHRPRSSKLRTERPQGHERLTMRPASPIA